MYSPVNVYNPASRNHAAILHPGQQLRVTFHDVSVLDECKAHVQSDFVELSHELFNGNGKTFVFVQRYDLSQWANVSTTFLGQIFFSGRGRVTPAVSMYMESVNDFKRDVVTVVNPDDQHLKIYPHQLLEVVCYSPLWSQELEWEPDFGETQALELVSDIRIDPTIYKMSESIRRLNDAFFTYPRMLQVSGVSYLEYHWWFRWKEMSANLAKAFQCPPVTISFTGSVHGEVKIRQMLDVSINDRAKEGWQDSRSYQVTFEDSAMDKGQEDFTVQPFILPALRNDKTTYYGHPGKKRHKKNKGIQYPPLHNRHKSTHNYQQPKPYAKKFEAREVVVKLKPPGPIDQGCRVVSDDFAYVAPSTTTHVSAAHSATLPAPYKPPESLGYTNFRGKSQYTPPASGKGAYFYDSTDEQWD